MRKLYFLAVAACLAPATPSMAQSVGVEPLFLEIAPSQTSALRMKNSSTNPVTVEVEVAERTVDEEGVQKRKPSDDDFIVFPPQATVPAQSLQVIRLQPVSPTLTQSKSYFVTVRQVPVEMPTTGTGARLQVIFAFDSAVHVVPRGAKPELVIVGAKPARTMIEVATDEFKTEPSGRRTRVMKQVDVPAIAITVRNDGNKYFYLQDIVLSGQIKDADKGEIDLPKWSQEDILRAVRVSLVQPGATRNFKLPLPETQNPVSVALTGKLNSSR
jgi:fimbrial chaperone protein